MLRRPHADSVDGGPSPRNGTIEESVCTGVIGDNDNPAPIVSDRGGAWKLWKTMAERDRAFGYPEKFSENIPDANWTISATATLTDDKIWPYIEKLTGRDPRSGHIVTGGPCNIEDSSWMYGFTVSRQPHFAAQDPQKEIVVWLYGLYSDKPGDYIKKTIRCSRRRDRRPRPQLGAHHPVQHAVHHVVLHAPCRRRPSARRARRLEEPRVPRQLRRDRA